MMDDVCPVVGARPFSKRLPLSEVISTENSDAGSNREWRPALNGGTVANIMMFCASHHLSYLISFLSELIIVIIKTGCLK